MPPVNERSAAVVPPPRARELVANRQLGQSLIDMAAKALDAGQIEQSIRYVNAAYDVFDADLDLRPDKSATVTYLAATRAG